MAIGALADKLQGARPVEQFGLSPQVRCAVFDGPRGPFCMIWRENRDENDTRSYVLPLAAGVAARVEAQDMFGRPMKAEGRNGTLEVKVSEIPVYVIGAKDFGAKALASALRDAAKRVDFRFDSPLKPSLVRRKSARP